MEQDWFDLMEQEGLFEKYGIEISPCQQGTGKCYMRNDNGNKVEVGPDQIKEVFNI